MKQKFINVKNYDVDECDVGRGDVTRSDVNSCDVVRFQKVIRNISNVEYGTAPTKGLNGLIATNEKASNPSRDEVDQSKVGRSIKLGIYWLKALNLTVTLSWHLQLWRRTFSELGPQSANHQEVCK